MSRHGKQAPSRLRDINVGRAKGIAMADGRALVANLGYRDRRTLLNRGKVVFTAGRGDPKSIAVRIERALPAKLGVSAGSPCSGAAEFSTVVRE